MGPNLTRRAILFCAGSYMLRKSQSRAATPNQGHPIKLFFYPSPLELSGRRFIGSPITIDVRQATDDFPAINEMAGVVCVLFWSDLSPSSLIFNTDKIDYCLKFWRRRGKQVILDVATVGVPIVNRDDPRRPPTLATPSWVMDDVATSVELQDVLGATKFGVYSPRRAVRTPSYWDSRFLNYVDSLALNLSKYDGDPSIATIRIPIGVLGEDNPTPDGARLKTQGYTAERWINYCHQVSRSFISRFSKTRLEFDLDTLGWIYAGQNNEDRQKVIAFQDYLLREGVYLAMNGFDQRNVEAWRSHKQVGGVGSLDLLLRSRQAGKSVGLEATLPLRSPLMQNVDELAAGFRSVGANRLVLFADAAACLNLDREGPNNSNRFAQFGLSGDRRNIVLENTKRLFAELDILSPT